MTTHTAAGRTLARLDKILETIRAPRFLQKSGQGNELGFHVFDYPPEDELLVRSHVDLLKRQLEKCPEVNPVFIDLYEEILGLLEDRGILDKIPGMEEGDPDGFSGVLVKLRRGPLRPENIVSRLQRRIQPEHNLVLITGAGKAFPMVRSHTILNNLHHPLAEKSVILFFPGGYDQKELQLFNRMKDDNYYRAFRLVGDKC